MARKVGVWGFFMCKHWTFWICWMKLTLMKGIFITIKGRPRKQLFLTFVVMGHIIVNVYKYFRASLYKQRRQFFLQINSCAKGLTMKPLDLKEQNKSGWVLHPRFQTEYRLYKNFALICIIILFVIHFWNPYNETHSNRKLTSINLTVSLYYC